MKRISIRELRQHASIWLREVQTGQSFEVTDRGRPVALLTPLPRAGELERLIAAGRIQPPKDDLLSNGPPLPPRAGAPLSSLVLEQLRAAER